MALVAVLFDSEGKWRFLLNICQISLKPEWTIQRYIRRFGFVCSTDIKRNMGGQVKKIRTFGASLFSVRSMQIGIGTREQVQFICNWRKRASLCSKITQVILTDYSLLGVVDGGVPMSHVDHKKW